MRSVYFMKISSIVIFVWSRMYIANCIYQGVNVSLLIIPKTHIFIFSDGNYNLAIVFY